MGGITRTSGKNSTETISELNTRYTADINLYKEYAEKRRNNRKVSQEFGALIPERMAAYIEKQADTKKPLTIAGAILALNIGKDTFYRIKNGDMDYITEEYRTLHADEPILLDALGNEYITNPEGELIPLAPLSELLEKYVLLPLEESLQSNCMSLRGNPAGNIFLLKAQMGYKEESEVKEVHQNLIIADREKATSILKMLGE